MLRIRPHSTHASQSLWILFSDNPTLRRWHLFVIFDLVSYIRVTPNQRQGVYFQQTLVCLFKIISRLAMNKHAKLYMYVLPSARNPPITGRFTAQRAIIRKSVRAITSLWIMFNSNQSMLEKIHTVVKVSRVTWLLVSPPIRSREGRIMLISLTIVRRKLFVCLNC